MTNVCLYKDSPLTTIYYSDPNNWEISRCPVTSIDPPGIPTDPDRDPNDGTFLFGYVIQEVVMGVLQLKREFRRDSLLYVDIHWEATTTGSGNVLWRLEYQKASIDCVFPGVWTQINKLIPVSGVTNKHVLTTLGIIDMSGMCLNSIIKWRLSRVGGDASDTYNADAKLLEVNMLYQKDAIGSGEQYQK